MKFAIFLVSLLSLLTLSAQASENHRVFDIKKSLALKDKQKSFKDYYVDLGTEQGAQVGSILAVYRRQGIIDHNRNILHEDLLIPVGHLRIIQAGQTASVARLASLTPRKDIPVVEFSTVMMGDRVVLVAGATKKK